MFITLKKINIINVFVFITFLSCLFLTCVMTSLAQPLKNPRYTYLPEVGLWATKENDGVFRIYSCGQQELCGRFVGMQYTTPLPPKSEYGNSQCNFLMLRHFTKDNSGKRWSGKILDPRNEKSYDAKIWLSNKGELKVRGYLGITLFGETHTWHRFTGNILKNCLLSH